MDIKRISISTLLIAATIIILITYFKFLKSNDIEEIESDTIEENSFSSNIIKEVNYISKDAKGNEYIINAKTGVINLKNSEKIDIKSDFGKYNSKNYDTIFSKNVIIKYLEHNITGEYLDFSLEKNLMVISRNIVYTSLENILKADVLEMDIQTKDTVIFMYEEDKKVNIKSKN